MPAPAGWQAWQVAADKKEKGPASPPGPTTVELVVFI
jgi:hypothetical protein